MVIFFVGFDQNVKYFQTLKETYTASSILNYRKKGLLFWLFGNNYFYNIRTYDALLKKKKYLHIERQFLTINNNTKY